jgi:hypothetical protein
MPARPQRKFDATKMKRATFRQFVPSPTIQTIKQLHQPKASNLIKINKMTKPDFIKGHQMFVNGKAVWAKVTNATGPNDMSQKFQLDLELDEASLAEIQSFGPRVFEAVVKTTRKAKDSDARVECTPFITPKSNNLPRVFGANRLPYDGPNRKRFRCSLPNHHQSF